MPSAMPNVDVHLGRSRALAAAHTVGLAALLLLLLGLCEMSREQTAVSHQMRTGLAELATIATLRTDLALVAADARADQPERAPADGFRFADLSRQVEGDLSALTSLAENDARLLSALAGLRAVVADRLVAWQRLIAAAAAGEPHDDPRATVRTREILSRVGTLENTVQHRLTERDRWGRARSRWLLAGLLACSGLAAACGFFSAAVQVARRRERNYLATLRESEERMRLLLDGADDTSIVMLDPAGRVATWHVGAERMMGFTAAEIIGQAYAHLFPHEIECADRLLRAARETGPVRTEFDRRRSDGTCFAASINLTALFDEQGCLRGYAEVARNVTERRHAELALRESEARFRAMAEATPAILLEANAVGALVYINRAGEDYAGAGRHDLLGTSWADVIHPDDHRRLRENAGAALEAGRSAEIEFRLCRHDGVYRWFLGSVVPVRDPNGAVTRWLAVVKDIDERKRAAAVLARDRDELERLVAARTAELAASEAKERDTAERFRMLAEHASDLVVQIGRDGSLLYVSPVADRLYGPTGEAEARRNPYTTVHPDDRDAVTESRQRMRAGLVERETLTFRIESGLRGTVWVESAARLLRDPATGEPDGYVSVLRDVTERRRLEDSLRHAQKLEAIGQIAAGVAHDFNNLLQNVIGGLELATEVIGPGAAGYEYIELALNSAERGSSLTHHLLSYARKQVLHPRTLDVVAFVSEMRTLLARVLGPHIIVCFEADPDVPSIHVDANQLHTAILNLSINAADAMAAGGRLRLQIRRPGAPGEDVRLLVVDDGVGMDEATLAQACEPFFTTKGLDGTGLGLSMVQGFVEQSGGRLRLESQANKGTTVELSFPAVTAPPRPAPDRAELPQPSRRVLVVDDEPDTLVTAGAFLERAGLWVVRANDAAEALEELESDTPFDALVTDYAMPGMNGFELVTAALEHRPHLPVLIITGYAELRGLDALPGTIQVLHKPFLRSELLRALYQVMVRGGEQVGADTLLGQHPTAPTRSLG